ncbi:MAG: 7-cyano-7-deazaguanine synthase QueC [Mariprofundaceae bacterium]|nr:7-cyano-7-deazaguanine synthase QueC [Mariprofundaceae bacterium]
MTNAIVLLSGGLDSTTALAWARKEKQWSCHTIAFDYGQRHRIELQAAAKVSHILGAVKHHEIKLDMRSIGGSALTDSIDVPKDHSDSDAIPITYVPARNLIFLSLAAALAEQVEATRIIIGANIVDYSGYPDCRPAFLNAFETTVNLGTKQGVEKSPMKIEAPLLDMTKEEIIALGLRLGVDYSMTHSCYDPSKDGRSCGHCDSCLFRQQGFFNLGKQDPLTYAS